MLPEPEPVSALTVYMLPEPLTVRMEAPVTPVAVMAKSVVSTPVTDSVNVTVKSTLAVLVGSGFARTMEFAVGAVISAQFAHQQGLLSMKSISASYR